MLAAKDALVPRYGAAAVVLLRPNLEVEFTTTDMRTRAIPKLAPDPLRSDDLAASVWTADLFVAR